MATPGPQATSLALVDVARFLLQEGYLLSALELHQELLETGVDLPILKKEFRELKPRQSKQPPKKLEKLPLEEQLKQKEDTLGRLQNDLSVARETINSLRQEIEMLTHNNTHSRSTTRPRGNTVGEIRSGEERAMDFLVHQYLSRQGYKMSAVTFLSEAPDDLNDWNEISSRSGASNISSEPPSLFDLYYRYFFNTVEESSKPKISSVTSETKTDSKATANPTHVSTKANNNPNSSTTNKVPLNPAKKRRKFEEISPTKPRKYESEDQVRISELLERIVSSDKERSLVRICGESIPYIVNGVIVKKREELIPLLMTLIAQHPEPSVRSDFIKMMLNLIKKPNEYERDIIMTSIVYLASIVGPERTETEILFALSEEYNAPPSTSSTTTTTTTTTTTAPKVTTSKNVKHEEKRIMIAKLCGKLCEFARPEIQSSLLLSILLSFLNDNSPLVREAVCESLAHLVTLLRDPLDAKYSRVEDALFTLLWDADHQVRSTAVNLLLSAVSDWVDSWGQLGPKLATRFLKEIEQELPRFAIANTVILDSSSSTSTIITNSSSSSSASNISSMKLVDQDQVGVLASVLFQAFESLLPKFKKAMIWGSPFALEILSNSNLPSFSSSFDYSTKEPELIKLIDTFLLENSSKEKYWPELSWLLETLIPKLLSLILKTEVPPKAQISSPAVRGLLQIVLGTASTFGRTFTNLFIKSKFLEEIFPKNLPLSASSASSLNSQQQAMLQKKEETKRREKLVPIYYAGVLTSLTSKELEDSLRDFIVSLSQNDKGWTRDQLPILSSSLTLLYKSATVSDSQRKQQIFQLLHDLESHSLNFVRATLAQLYNNLIAVLGTDEISKKIVPALSTLGADPDKIVRIYIIRAYGNLAVNVDDPFILEKVGIQLSTFFEDDRHSTRIELAKIFIQMIPTVSSKFRDHFILPRLTQLTSKLISANANATEQKDLAKLLFECFRALNGTVTELEAVQEFLNGLRSLSDSKLLDSTYKTMMDSMTSDMEQHISKLTDPAQDKNAKPTSNFGLWGGFDFKKFTGPAAPNSKS